MPTSLFSAETQAVLDGAEAAAGTHGGPFPSPADWRDLPIYFLMVDRFSAAAPPVHTPFDDPNFYAFQGGSFAGVQARLQYIKQLGAGAIWLSPVLKNLRFDAGSYHGYGIHDFLSAEPRFATNAANADDELRALVDAAHAAGLYVIFEIVLNRVGDVFVYPGQPDPTPFSPTPLPVQWRTALGVADPTATDIGSIANPSRDAVAWPAELQQNSFFRRQGNPLNGGDDTIGDFDSLKQLVTADPSLQGFLIRAYQYVVARYDIDGFRIDTLRYLKGDLARLFGNSIREFALSIGKKNFFTYGEVLDGNSESDIARFIGRSTSDPDTNSLVGVDAALDYPLFNSLKPVVKAFAAPTTVVGMYENRKQVEQYILSSHGDATRFFVTFLDNHDMKERLRFVQAGNEHAFDDQVTLGFACLFALQGIPCVYYGTEQGLHGSGSDPAVREALWGIAPTFPQNTFFYEAIQEIATVRAAEPALRYGRLYFRPLAGVGATSFGISPFPGGILAWSRILNDQEVVVVANTNTNLTLSVRVIVELALSTVGTTFRVLYSNKPAPVGPGPVTNLSQATVAEVDGGTGFGPLHALTVTLAPMEVQILRQ
jgi:glycosidase